MPASFIWPGRPGPWGCGVVLANPTSAEVDLCQRLGQALERLGEDDFVAGNDPARLTFQALQ